MSEPQSLSEVEGYSPFYLIAVIIGTAALISLFLGGALYHVLFGNVVFGAFVLLTMFGLAGVVARIFATDSDA